MGQKILLIFSCLFVLFFSAPCAHTSHQPTSTERTLKSISEKENSLYYFLVSELEELHGKKETSLFYLDKTIKQDPHSSYLILQKAYRLARENKLKKAYQIAKKIYKQETTNYDVVILLGKIHTAEAQSKKSIHFYNQAIKIKPNQEEAYHLLAREQIAQKEPKEAMITL